MSQLAASLEQTIAAARAAAKEHVDAATAGLVARIEELEAKVDQLLVPDKAPAARSARAKSAPTP
jgi:hypothetical protein